MNENQPSNDINAYHNLIYRLENIKFLSEWPKGMGIWIKDWSKSKDYENDNWITMLTWVDMDMNESEDWHLLFILPDTKEEFMKSEYRFLDGEILGWYF